MRSRGLQTALAVAAISLATAGYAAVYVRTGQLPAASGLLGHSLGLLGIILMLATQTLYSIRKQVDDARWGSTESWLRLHVVTGLVGPFLVLLHSGLRFSGLAGVAMALTAVVVASGAVGRFLYSSVPRLAPAEGSVAAVPAGSTSMAADLGGGAITYGSRRAWATWYSLHVPLTWALFAVSLVHAAAALYYATLQR
jgi:cytochrome b561